MSKAMRPHYFTSGPLLPHRSERTSDQPNSDFPHGDPSAEENYVTRWRERSDMPERVKEKILGKNAERFFRL